MFLPFWVLVILISIAILIIAGMASSGGGDYSLAPLVFFGGGLILIMATWILYLALRVWIGIV